ncbi:hypothetical protein TVNIR_3354 [Thioalkalivibrio nitratireducens DSM 14787]|uniref:Uncharacterized protein n=1 Tax=Thioalkalivibrio nitratireducens (strain DSM 14787 / UNIQEM 213 / ALEN2) TaxID=1255043 RepID=L0E1B0_THIND|nr:hypothetical protein TVNIR_3354 [Thioalkalivibrio nitratireducens DSM 14787]
MDVSCAIPAVEISDGRCHWNERSSTEFLESGSSARQSVEPAWAGRWAGAGTRASRGRHAVVSVVIPRPAQDRERMTP